MVNTKSLKSYRYDVINVLNYNILEKHLWKKMLHLENKLKNVVWLTVLCQTMRFDAYR